MEKGALGAFFLVQRSGDVAEVQGKFTLAPILEEMPQGVADAGKGQVIPGDGGFAEQRHFQALAAWFEVEVEQAAAEEQVHLADVRQIVERVKGDDFDAGVRLLRGFARRRLGRGFVVFHEPRW